MEYNVYNVYFVFHGYSTIAVNHFRTFAYLQSILTSRFITIIDDIFNIQIGVRHFFVHKHEEATYNSRDMDNSVQIS